MGIANRSIGLGGLLGLLRQSAWGTLDQATLSFCSFGTLVIVARAASAVELGLFSLCLSAIAIETLIATAILNQAYTVLSASRGPESYKKYVSCVFVTHLALGGVAVMLVMLLAMLALAFDSHIALLILLVAPAMASAQLQEFTHDAMYVEDRPPAAFLNSVISYGGQFLGVGLAYALGLLTIQSALLIIAITSFISALVGFWQLRRSLVWPLSRADLREANEENWRFSRWTLGSAIVSSTSVLVLPFVLAAFAGAASAGILRVLVSFVGPMRIVGRGVQVAFGPKAARVEQTEGSAGLRRLVAQILVVGVVPIAVYGTAISVFARPVLREFYGEEYAKHAGVMAIVVLSQLLTFLYIPFELGLRARRITNVLFQASLLGFLSFWVIGLPAMYVYKLTGAALAMAITPAVFGLVVLYYFSTEMRSGEKTI